MTQIISLPTSHSLLPLHFWRPAQRHPLVILFELKPRLADLKLFAEVGVAFQEKRLRTVVGGGHFPLPRFSKQELLSRDSALDDLLAIDHGRFLQFPVKRRVDNREIAASLHAPDLQLLDRDE